MLRKKLSKLIVAVMAAVMLSGGMSGVGQAAFASSNAGVVTTEARAVQNATTPQEMLTHVKDSKVSTINVTASIALDKDIITAINSRTTQLTIEVSGNGVLEIPTNTFTQAVTIDGNGQSNPSQSLITIARGTGKTGELLRIANGVQSGVVIKNVIFNNGNDDKQSAIIRNGQNDKVTLDSNYLVGKGSLVNQNAALTGFEFKNNSLGEGNLLSKQTLPVTFNAVPGPTVINFSGSIKDDGTSVNVQVGSTATVIVKDASNKEVFKDVTALDVMNGTSNRFNEAKFSLDVTGLAQNAKYSAEVTFNIVDEVKNKYTRVQTVNNLETKGTFSSTVTSTGNNSATITLNHGDLATTSYPLTLEVFNGSTSVFVQRDIRHSTTSTSVNVTGLASGTRYNYEIRDNADVVINTGTFTTTSSTITGGGSTGGSVTTGDLTSSDINKADIKDVSASIPVGSTTLLNSLKNGKDYKTNIEGVSVTFTNDKIELSGLVPGKDYKDLTITYTDKDGRTRTVKVPTFKTKTSETKLRQFIVDVYSNSLSRTPDERGFAYWEDQLKNKKTTPEEFVKNLLNEKEFIEKHKTTTEKIEALYKVIVNRSSDSQGLSYWTTKYDDLVKKGYSESMALKVTVDEMVNEQEFKNRVQNLGL